jgi:hypothetical protein
MREPAISWITLRHDCDSKKLHRLLKGRLCFKRMFSKNAVFLVSNDQLQNIRNAGIEFDRTESRSVSEALTDGCVLVIRGTPSVQKNKSAASTC